MTVYHKSGNAETDEKQGLAALLAQSTTAGIAATGVLYGLAVSQTATASGSVQIAQGAGAVQASLTAGASLLYNPAPTLNIMTANPVGSLPRNDIVVFDSTTGNVSAIIGTANATPTDPTVPATALKLARIRNAANATTIPAANIDDLRVYTQLLGVAVPAYGTYNQQSGLSIPTGAWTMVYAWGPVYQRGVTYSGGIFTVPTAGRYKIEGVVTFPQVSSPNGQRALRLLQNGNIVWEYSGARPDAVYNTSLPFAAGLNVAAGDTFQVQVYQSQGTSQTTVTTPGTMSVSIDRISSV